MRVFPLELRASLGQAQRSPCKPLQGFNIGDTETLRRTCRNHASLLELNQKRTQPINAECEKVCHHPTVEGLHQQSWIATLLLVLARERQQEGSESPERILLTESN